MLGALAHLEPVQDVVRMLYYLTGQVTERSAVLGLQPAPRRAHRARRARRGRLGRRADQAQEPGHHAFYALSARGLAAQLAPGQRWLVRRLRALSFAPVGVSDATQLADFGDVMTTLGTTEGVDSFAEQVARLERELLRAHAEGMRVPPYVLRAFADAADAAAAR